MNNFHKQHKHIAYPSFWSDDKLSSFASLSAALDEWTADARQTAIKKQATPGNRISALLIRSSKK